MKLISSLLSRIRRSRAVTVIPHHHEPAGTVIEGTYTESFDGCGHPGPRINLKIRVFGAEVTILKSPLCRDCTEIRMNECSTHCAGCDQPILPFMSIAAAWIGAPHPHTHMSDTCGDPNFYDGLWGAGRHITLAELYPDQFGEQKAPVAESIDRELFTIPVARLAPPAA